MTPTHSNAPVHRWSLLDPLSRLGTGLISFFALGSETGGGSGGSGPEKAVSASATAVSELRGPGCCHLALPNTPCSHPQGQPCKYTCPEGYYRQWWYCREGTRQRGCAECTGDRDSCWYGPFNCSIWWWQDECRP